MEGGLRTLKFGIEPAESGERTLFFEREGRRHYLYSRRDPGRDGLRFREERRFGASGLLVFIGVGLGHHIRPFLEDRDTREIAVLEPCEELFEAVRGTEEIESLTRDPRVAIRVGETAREYVDGLGGRYDALVKGSVRVLSFPPLCAALPSIYKVLEEHARSRIELLAGDALTIGRFARLWLGNFASNVREASSCAPVSSLFGASQAGTAVVSGAGPSLDGVRSALKAFRGRFFLVATDASVRPLALSGVFPDLIVSVDPQPLVGLHLQGIDREALEGVPAVLSLLSCPAVFGRFRERYLFFTLHPTTRLFDTGYLRGEGAMLNYRSVGSYALKVALEMGFDTLLLAGFDFAYPGLRVYANDSFFHEAGLARWSRFTTLPTLEAGTMAGASAVTARAAEAQTSVLTCRILREYAEEFEGVAGEARARDTRVLRLGTGGIRIGGVEAVEGSRVEELLRKTGNPLMGALKTPKTGALEPDPGRWGALRGDLTLTLALRRRIFQGARSGEEATETALRSLEGPADRVRRSLECRAASMKGFLKFAPPATDI
jgi:hypothetical protein